MYIRNVKSNCIRLTERLKENLNYFSYNFSLMKVLIKNILISHAIKENRIIITFFNVINLHLMMIIDMRNICDKVFTQLSWISRILVKPCYCNCLDIVVLLGSLKDLNVYKVIPTKFNFTLSWTSWSFIQICRQGVFSSSSL